MLPLPHGRATLSKAASRSSLLTKWRRAVVHSGSLRPEGVGNSQQPTAHRNSTHPHTQLTWGGDLGCRGAHPLLIFAEPLSPGATGVRGRSEATDTKTHKNKQG